LRSVSLPAAPDSNGTRGRSRQPEAGKENPKAKEIFAGGLKVGTKLQLDFSNCLMKQLFGI
jgi:hypothetical protein